MAASKRSHWEDLRKESRRLETEIDLKLVSFSKLGSTYSHRDDSVDGPVRTGHVFDTMTLEIEQLISKLRGVNDALNEYVSTVSSTSPSGSLYHTLQRHNEILQDYNKEFTRTKANIVAQRQREELLGQSRRDYKVSSGLNRRTELYLKENEQIRGSERLADEAISIAMSTKENLSHQRNVFAGVTNKVSSITSRFPLINSVVQKINIRKRRDSFILGGVVAVCIVILLIFVLR
ncbi:Golgi SNAP receptor complex member 1-like [Halichondria panicea]|uniref:Golgi SNAP receptor complex member 1-like n=1 Tax=Halichondria panicea TaxID=6063 RepID=UPI00312B4228